MNRLLLLTEFSDASQDAQRYAVALARGYGIPLTVLQQVVVPVPFVGPDEMLLPVVPIADTREAAQERLDKNMAALRRQNPDLIIEGQLFYGDVSGLADDDGVNDQDATVIVGNDVYGTDARWLDSSAPEMLRNASVTTIAVPQHGRYRPVSRMMLALDPTADLSKLPFQPLQYWLEVTGAELHVALVGDGQKDISDMQQHFPVQATFHNIPAADSLAAALLPAATQMGADWVVVTPHSHGILGGLFHKGHLQELAKGCPVPLVALHHKSVK